MASFTGDVEDCIKTGSLNKSSLVTSFADEDDHKNTKCEPEMEVLKNNEDDCEEKTTKFPAFAELLPTIGEEDEINVGREKIHSNESLAMISSVESNDGVIQTQLGKLEESNKGKIHSILKCLPILGSICSLI